MIVRDNDEQEEIYQSECMGREWVTAAVSVWERTRCAEILNRTAKYKCDIMSRSDALIFKVGKVLLFMDRVIHTYSDRI